jgi:hypothetical protein
MTRKSLKEIKHAERQRKQLLGRVAWSVAGLVVLALLGYVVWGFVRPKPGRSVPQMLASHIQPGTSHEPYNSDPPTSGPHFPQPAQAGFYDEALPDEQLVHNLEHGYVVIWYNCTGLDESACAGLKSQIKDLMDRAKPIVPATGAKKLIAVPRPGMESLLALTSWSRLDKLASFDEKEIVEFINDFRNHAPEPGAP